MSAWTKEQINYLKDNYPLHGAGYCAENLGRSPESITNKASRLKILRNGNSRYKRQEAPNGYLNCGGCNQTLPEGLFYSKKDIGKYGKRNNYCRNCCQKKARHHYGKYKWNMFERRKKNPIHFVYIRLKGSAKKRHIYFNLTEQELRDKFVTHCPVYGKKLIFFSNSDWSPSVDRINSKKGYVADNIIIVSKKVNMQKNNSTVKELKKLYEFYSNIEKLNLKK